MNKYPHLSDLALTEDQKYMIHSLIPIVSLANQLAINTDLDAQKAKTMLFVSISISGYGFTTYQ